MMNAVPAREERQRRRHHRHPPAPLGQTVGAALVAPGVQPVRLLERRAPSTPPRAALWLAAGFAATALVVGSLRLRH